MSDRAAMIRRYDSMAASGDYPDLPELDDLLADEDEGEQ